MNKAYLIALAIVIVAGAIYFAQQSTFLSGRVQMTRSQLPAVAKETDKLGHPAGKNGQKILVVYYSWGGNTREVAQYIHQEIGGDIYELRTVKHYPDEYDAATEDAKRELEADERPALAGNLPDVSGYDTILIGYPIWWYTVPRPVLTFAENQDFSGKRVALFCTSGGDELAGSEEEMQKAMPGANFVSGLTANVHSEIQPWLESIFQ